MPLTKKTFTLATALLCLVVASQMTSAEVLPSDISAAVKRSQADEKDLLIYFSGGTECAKCELLEDEVLSRPDFRAEIAPQYELVEVPQATGNTTRGMAATIAKWRERYGVKEAPVVVLVDDQQRPFGIVGYEEGGVENYLGMLIELQKARQDRDVFFDKAATESGMDKAKSLDQGLEAINDEIVTVYYDDIVQQIIALDRKDEAGLRSKYNAAKDAEMRKVVMTDLLLTARLEQPADAIAMIDQTMDEINFPVDQQLEILQIKLNILRASDDATAMDAVLDEMIRLPGVEGDTRQRLVVKKIILMAGSDRMDAAMELLDSEIGQSIAQGAGNLYLMAAKGELLMAKSKCKEAVEAFDQAIPMAARKPDVLIELISGKADALFELKQEADAVRMLDNFAEDTNMPPDLRCEAMLHKSMLIRAIGNLRLARLSENRAIEIANTPTLKAEIRKVVERLGAVYESEMVN